MLTALQLNASASAGGAARAAVRVHEVLSLGGPALVGRAGSRQPRAPLQGQVFALVLRWSVQRFGAVCIQD